VIVVSLQLAMILAYFLLVSFIGIIAGRMSKTSADFMMAGRNMGLVMCAAATAGEWIGGTSTIGVAEGGYIYGISSSWYPIANALGLVIFAFTLAELYRRLGEFTIPGIIERYLDVRCRIVSSVVLAAVMVIVGSLQVVAAGTIMTSVTTLNFQVSLVLVGLVFIAYTLSGGLWAIGLTNMLHVVVLYCGVITALVFAMRAGGGFAALRAELPAQPFFSMLGVSPSKVGAWIMASVMGVFTAQAAVQPILAARDEKTAKRASLLAAAVIAPLGLITSLTGMFARISFPGIDPKMGFPQLILTFSPAVGGLVLAGVLAAILSTVAPCILAAGTLLTNDVYRRLLRPEADDRTTYRVSRLLTLGAGLLALSIALFAPVILEAIYLAYTFRSAIFIILAAGIYWKRTRPEAALGAIVATSIATVAWETLKATGNGAYPYGLHPMYLALVISLLIIVAGSLWTRPAAKVGAGRTAAR